MFTFGQERSYLLIDFLWKLISKFYQIEQNGLVINTSNLAYCSSWTVLKKKTTKKPPIALQSVHQTWLISFNIQVHYIPLTKNSYSLNIDDKFCSDNQMSVAAIGYHLFLGLPLPLKLHHTNIWKQQFCFQIVCMLYCTSMVPQSHSSPSSLKPLPHNASPNNYKCQKIPQVIQNLLV